MANSTFAETLKRNIAALLNDDNGKMILAPAITPLGDDEEKQVLTVGDFEYSRTAAPGRDGRIESYRPKVKWKGDLLDEDMTDEQEKEVRAALKDLDTKITDSEHDLSPLLPKVEEANVKAVRTVIGDTDKEDNPTTFMDVKAAARKEEVTVTISGKDGSIRLRNAV